MTDLKKNVLSDDELREKVASILKSSLGKDEVAYDADFTEALDMDSITKMELLMAFEEAFDVQIKDEDAAKLTSINATVTLLKALIANE